MIALDIRITGVPEAMDATDRQIEQWEQELAYRIVDESRRLMDESVPTGRLYRRGNIRGRYLKGLKRVAGTKTRAIVGTRIHRASAPGQPPAEDTGRLYREITVRRMKKGTYRVRFGAPYAGYLEFNLNRPFVLPAVEAAVRKTFDQ